MQCKLCGGPLIEIGSLGSAGHYRCGSCGADQARMTARTDVTKPTKTRWQIALDVQHVSNPAAVANELCQQITLFSRAIDYSGTRSICEDTALRAIVFKLADLFGVSDSLAWDAISKSLH
jgi:hypothetical protein